MNGLGEMFVKGAGAGLWLVGAVVSIGAVALVLATICAVLAWALGDGRDDRS